MRIALEAGTHSPWVSRLLESLGHEVPVANPRKIRVCLAKMPSEQGMCWFCIRNGELCTGF